MEAAVDDDRVEVFARDGRRFNCDVRNVFGAVEESIGVGEFFAGSELDGAFGSEARELFDGLIDRDELGSFDALDGDDLGDDFGDFDDPLSDIDDDDIE